MTNWFSKQNLFFKLVIIYISCGFIAFIALCFVYLIPINKIQSNVNYSIPQIKSEGLSYHVTPQDANGLLEFFCNYKSTQLDNFSDSVMLLIASHNSERKFFQAALLGEHYEVDGVAMYALTGEGDPYYTIYPRYWHGYLIFLKPLLLLTNYLNIRKLLFIAETLLIALALFQLIKRKHIALCFPIIAMWIFFGPVAISKCMHYSNIYLITMTEILLILTHENKYRNCPQNWIIHFFIAGCATSFFDLLTNPLITFAIPFALMIFLYGETFIDCFINAIKTGLSWCLGYLMFWAGKWIGGSLILKTNILADAASSIALRTGDSVYDEKITYLTVLTRNLSAKPGQLIVALAAAVIALIIVLIIQKKTPSKNSKMSSKSYMFLLISLAPFAWYFAIKNHSGEHYFFTFRELSITVFSLWLFAVSLVTQLRQNTLQTSVHH